jgi:hypothetical protein
MAHESSIFDGSDETLLNTRQQREFFGGVSEMWLSRREKQRDEDERRKPGSGFPLPRWIARRKYRTLGELRRYRDAQPRALVKHDNRPPMPPPRPQKAKNGVTAAAERRLSDAELTGKSKAQ